jgi:hypothetical protein
VASETGAGLRSVQIRLSGGGLREGRTAGTDAEGRYEIDNLPAGRYTLTATKPGFVTLSFGQRRPFESGRPIEVVDKQLLEQADFALPRGGVIVVRVTDDGTRCPACGSGRTLPLPAGAATTRPVATGAGAAPAAIEISETRHGLPPGHFRQREWHFSRSLQPMGAADKGRSTRRATIRAPVA